MAAPAVLPPGPFGKPTMDPETKRVLDEAAAHDAALDLKETHSLPEGPPSEQSLGVVAAEAEGSSPSVIRDAEAQLIVRYTHLQEALPKLTEAARIANQAVRDSKAEMVEIERVLRVHKRLREPRKRVAA